MEGAAVIWMVLEESVHCFLGGFGLALLGLKNGEIEQGDGMSGVEGEGLEEDKFGFADAIQLDQGMGGAGKSSGEIRFHRQSGLIGSKCVFVPSLTGPEDAEIEGGDVIFRLSVEGGLEGFGGFFGVA